MNKAKFGLAIALLLLCQSANAIELYWQRAIDADLKTGTGSFASSQLGVSGTVNQWQSGNEELSVGARAERTSLNLSGTSTNYYWFSVPLEYQQWRSRSMALQLSLEPGVMASLQDIGSDTLAVNARLSLLTQLNARMAGQLGVMVDRRFGDDKAHPMAALQWQADAVTQVTLGYPVSQIQVQWSQGLETYAKAQPAGGIWAYKPEAASSGSGSGDTGSGDTGSEDTGSGDTGSGDTGSGDTGSGDTGSGDTGTGGTGSTDSGSTTTASSSTDWVKVKYQSWQAGVGAQLHWREALWAQAELGYVFERELSGAAVAKPENALYWRLGLSWRY